MLVLLRSNAPDSAPGYTLCAICRGEIRAFLLMPTLPQCCTLSRYTCMESFGSPSSLGYRYTLWLDLGRTGILIRGKNDLVTAFFPFVPGSSVVRGRRIDTGLDEECCHMNILRSIRQPIWALKAVQRFVCTAFSSLGRAQKRWNDQRNSLNCKNSGFRFFLC